MRVTVEYRACYFAAKIVKNAHSNLESECIMLTFAFQFRRLFAVFAVCSLSIWLGPRAARADVDDFNDGTDDGWTHYNPLNTGSWSFPNGAYRLQSAPSPS